MVTWVDPPSGWRYDFPKLWDGKGDVMEWIVKNGYPKREIDRLGDQFFMRYWAAEKTATCSD